MATPSPEGARSAAPLAPPILDPQDRLEPADVERGLRLQVADGMCSQSLVTLTQGPILVAFALLLGASNAVIGLVSAIGPFSNVLQVPAIFLVERSARRKALTVKACLASRAFWVVMAVLPWAVPPGARLPLLVAALAGHFGLAAVAGCAWNSWMHDLVPPAVLNRFFARRMAWSMGLGAALSLASGFFLDAWGRAGRGPYASYAVLFLAGAGAGFLGCLMLALTPEPRMRPQGLARMRDVVGEPFRDGRFRRLLAFLGTWTFAVNLAAPFFAVYLIRVLHQGMAWVLGLSVLSLVAFALSLRVWGRMADRHANKGVLAAAGPLLLLSIALWPLTSLPMPAPALHGLLVAIHVLAGVSLGGVTLSSGNIALKEAPRGKATAYLATNSLTAGLAATAAPLLAGLGADLAARGGAGVALGPLTLGALDLVFLGAVLVGGVALRLLARVREEGEPKEPIQVPAIWAEGLREVWQTTTVAGLRRLSAFPYARLRALLIRRARR